MSDALKATTGTRAPGVVESRRTGPPIVALLVATLLASTMSPMARGQHEPFEIRIVHDWTIGPDEAYVGLRQYEGFLEGTYISWGFGGVMTTGSAPVVALAAAAPLAVCLCLGGLAFAYSVRRTRGSSDS